MFNKNTRTFLLLSLVFITLLGVSTAAAADIGNDATDAPTIVQDTTPTEANVASDNSVTNDVSTKNAEITKKTVENVKTEGEGNFTQLQSDIDSSSDLTLDKDYIYDNTTTDSILKIEKEITIDAGGHKLTSNNGVFNILQNGTLTLKNAVITGESPNADFISLRGNLILDHVVFDDCFIERRYFAPVYLYTGSNLTATDCIFNGIWNNRAVIYGYMSCNINLENCNFTNTNASNSAVYARQASNVIIKNCNFINGTGSNYGGALYINNANSVSLVENCLFENNSATQFGGAIYNNGKLTVNNSVFRKNNQTGTYSTYSNRFQHAGAIWESNANSVLCLENNVMEDNEAMNANIYFDAGKINSTIKVVGESVEADEESPVEIILNVTDDKGNSIDFKTSPFTMSINDENIPITYANGTITASFDASYDPGEYDITINYDDSVIIGNVDIPKITLTVKDVGLIKYADVQALIDSATPGSTITIDGTVYRGKSESIVIKKYVTLDFNGNVINAKSGKVFDIPGVATIKNAYIMGVDNPNVNISNSEGRIANVSGILTFDNVTFVNNKAPNFGSSYSSSAYGSFILALFEDSYVELKDCEVINCSGTFINNVNSTVKIDNTYFIQNNLGSSGDAVIANGGNLEINGSVFYNNTVNIATIRGQSNTLASSVYGNYITCSNKPLTINRTIFSGNYAGSGRGAAVNTQNDTTITECVFVDNRINQYSNKGGAVFSERGDLNIDRCLFINNSARVTSYSANEGTAIYNSEGNMNIQNSIILSNVTEVSAVYNDAKDATVVANGNYWGTNNITGRYASGSSADEITVDNWVVLNVTVDPADNIKYLDELTVKATLNTLNDGTPISGKLPDHESVDFTAQNGVVSPETVDMDNGFAATSLTVKYSPFTVTAKYMDNEVSYTANATMPDPEVITLNDANWTSYFNDDGTLNTTTVVPNSELRFEGVFDARDMIIDMPLNITTADTQAVLNNCTITVKSDGVKITKIEMNAEDYADCLINIDGASNVIVEDNKLTLTNNEEKAITHTIEVTGGENNIIRNNNISTVGPEENIVYNAEYTDIVTLYTTSIYANASDNLTISGNRIFTEKNGKDSAVSGTIYGVYVRGENNENIISNIKITDNTIVTMCEVYAYGLTFNYAEDSLVGNNFINTVSKLYADGMQSYHISDSTINNNTIDCSAENLTYGIIVNGEIDWDTYETFVSESNIVSNNTVILESDYSWGIELFVGEENTIVNNEISIISDFGVGIGLADSSYNDIIENNVEVTATMLGSGESMDAVSPYTAGVKVQQSGMPMHAATYNNVINNTIIVTAPVDTVPAVNVTTRSTVTGNYLEAPLGLGDKAVNNTASYGTTIKDNTPGEFNITDSTYSKFFDDSCTLYPKYSESTLIAQGEFINNTYFIFDNIKVLFTTDGTAKFINSSFIVGNDAQVILDGLEIDNTDMEAIWIESEGNIISNTIVNVVSDYAITPVQILAENNTITDSVINATIPSGDVQYDYTTWAVLATAPAGLYINSSNVLVEDTLIYVDGTAIAEGSHYPTINGIDIESINDIIIENITIAECDIIVLGPNYVYGINVGPTNHTTIEDVDIAVSSDFFAYGIQLFDAENLIADGYINAESATEAYGVYSSAMGRGVSQYLNFTELDIDATAPNAFGVKIEGSSNVIIADAEYNINGENATAVTVYPAVFYDASYNPIYVYPQNITVIGMEINIDTTGDENVLYFGACDKVYVLDNTILGNNGSEVLFNSTTNAEATDNYIKLSKDLIGDSAFKTTETDTVIKDNEPTMSTLIDELLKQIEELQQQIEDQNNTINNLTENVTNLENNLTEANNQITDLNNTVQQQNETINNLNQTVQEQQETITQLEENITNLENNLTEANNQITDLNNTVQQQAETINALNQTVQEQQANIENLNQTIQEQQANIENLNQTIQALEEMINNLNSNLTDANNKIADLNNTVQQQETTIGNLENNLTQANNQITDLNNTVQEQQETITDLNNNITQANGQIANLNNKVQQQQSTINNLNNDLTQANNQITDLNNTVQQQSETINALNQTTQQQQETIGNLENNLTQANNQITDLNNTVQQQETTIGNLENNLTQANNKIDELNNTVQQQAETINTLNQTTQQQQETIGNLENNLTEANNQITDLNNTVQQQETTIDTLNQTVQEQQESINQLNEKIDAITKILEELTNKETTLTIDEIEDARASTPITISGKLVDRAGKLIPDQTITLTVNGEDKTVTTANGKFEYTATFTTGEQTVTANYAGTANYDASNATITFNVEKADCVVTIDEITPVKFGENVTIIGTFMNVNGKAIANSNVKVQINGQVYYAKTNSKGIWTLSAKVTKAGENTVTAAYGGSANYNSYSTDTTFTADKQDLDITVDDVSFTENNFTLSGVFKDKTGKVVKNTKVRVYVNGKNEYVMSDDSGKFTYSTAVTKNTVTYYVAYGGSASYNAFTGTKTTISA